MDDAVWAAVYATVSTDTGRAVGAAILRPRARDSRDDLRSKEVVLLQFLDGERYANTESLLVSFAPTHIYLADTLGEAETKKLEQMLDAAELTSERAGKSIFADTDTLSIANKLHGEAIHDLDKVPLGVRAFAGLIKKGELGTSSDDFGTLKVQVGVHDAFMRLDAAALRALNLFTTSRDAAAVPTLAEVTPAGGTAAEASGTGSAGNRITSLHGLVSYGCKTKGGRRLLRQWILQPLVDLQQIRARQDLVSAFVTCSSLRKSWKEGTNVPDLDALAARLNRKNASLLDLLRLYQFSLLLPTLVSKLEAFDGGESLKATLQDKFIAKMNWAAEELRKYMEMCEQVIEDVSSPEPRINPRWDERLKELADEREEIESGVLELFNAAKSGWADQLDGELKCERDKVRGFVFRTRRTNEKALRAIPSVHICQVLKDGIHFTTLGSAGLKSLGERILEIDADYEVQSRAVVTQAIDIARSYAPVLEASSSLVSELDAFCSLAHMAVSAPGKYVRPDVREAGSSIMRVSGGRHPVMEIQEGVTYIANEYEMNRTLSRFHIITGPNMGGKSTYIRTIGVIAVMAQLGSYVPAEEAVLPIFDSICARIGAGDKAVKGVSTFMAEMLEASSILASASEKSLVIIDELGRGTSTYDGFGLAWAISEQLCEKTRCFTLFATHFHELTALAQSCECARNRHVTAHTTEDSITMLYTVRDGVCPSSFGIHVAELAAFPPSVIATARAKAAELEMTSAVSVTGAARGLPLEALQRAAVRLRGEAGFTSLPTEAKRSRFLSVAEECC